MIAGRIPALQATLVEDDVAALVVTHLPNIRYLCGFTGSHARLLVAGDDVVLVTDGRYRDQADAELDAAGVEAELVVTAEPVAAALEARVAACPGIAVESTTPWSEVRAMADAWGCELVPRGGAVEAMRAVKDPDEIDVIRRAVELADASLSTVLGGAGPAATEAELALALEWEMRTRGASGAAFDVIVAAGPHAALPHATPRPEVVGRDRMVVVDFGCVVDGYCSDCTRTFCWGEPHPDLAEAWDVVAGAQDAARAALAPGVLASEVDAAAREVVTAAGLGDCFVHGTGHGVGLEIHEKPRLSARSDEVLEAGMVVTIEPGVYVGGLGGVRLEDVVVVTAAGCETLTTSPREMLAP
ncbi:MAG: Xaa-Pro peptidase family protein [Acidimicrobiia bacterium]